MPGQDSEMLYKLSEVFTDTSPQFINPYQPSFLDPIEVSIRVPAEVTEVNLIAEYEVAYAYPLDINLEEVKSKLPEGQYQIENYPKGREEYKLIRIQEKLSLDPSREKSFKDYKYYYFLLPPLLKVVPPPLERPRVISSEIRYFFSVIISGKRFKVDATVIGYPALPQLALEEKVFPFRIVPGFRTPEWVKGAVLYQIFPDRFYNGDPSNDPRDGEYIYDGKPIVKRSWNDLPDVTPYPEGNRTREFFGGDLKGVMDKLDYLHQLGISGIYLNPIFLSPSNHKYDTQDYEHVDPHLGKIVVDGDYKDRISARNLMASDELLTKLAIEAKKRGIRLVLDGVFNHCGSRHRWLREALENPNSPYRRFFNWKSEKEYDSWWGVKTLPKLYYENAPELDEYIIQIGKLWLGRGASGWRLDVAEELGYSPEFNRYFWRKFRSEIKDLDPNAYIVAEAYGRFNQWFASRAWDSIMNYNAFFEPVSWFFTGMERHSYEYREDLKGNVRWFIKTMAEESSFLPWPALTTAMNQLSNHDHSRFLTRTTGIVDSSGGSPPQERAYEGAKPDLMKLGVIFQMFWVGTPTIYYGDEVGLGGFTDPDNRRTFPWDTMNGELGRDLLELHKTLIWLRRKLPVKNGSVAFLRAGERSFLFTRFSREKAVIIGIKMRGSNKEDDREVLKLDLSWYKRILKGNQRTWKIEEVFKLNDADYSLDGSLLEVSLKGNSALILTLDTKKLEIKNPEDADQGK